MHESLLDATSWTTSFTVDWTQSFFTNISHQVFLLHHIAYHCNGITFVTLSLLVMMPNALISVFNHERTACRKHLLTMLCSCCSQGRKPSWHGWCSFLGWRSWFLCTFIISLDKPSSLSAIVFFGVSILFFSIASGEHTWVGSAFPSCCMLAL